MTFLVLNYFLGIIIGWDSMVRIATGIQQEIPAKF